jgi:hypothetical protein
MTAPARACAPLRPVSVEPWKRTPVVVALENWAPLRLRHRKVGLIQPAAAEEHVAERAPREDGARQSTFVEDDPGKAGLVEIGTGEI